MKDTIKIIQHIHTYVDIGERRSGLERHCETIPAHSKSKLIKKTQLSKPITPFILELLEQSRNLVEADN